MFLFSIVQWIAATLPTSAGQNMMRLLVGTGQVFKESTRVDYSWNVLNIPHYIASHFEAEIAVDHNIDKYPMYRIGNCSREQMP